MEHAIATEKLTRRFGRLEAVHDLTLRVPAGSIFGLIGPNGAGKTTALKLLMNIIEPTMGRAEVLGWTAGGSGRRSSRRSGTSPRTSRCRSG